VWERSGEAKNMGQPKGHPLAHGYDAHVYQRFPEPDAPGRFTTARAQLKQAGDRYVLADCSLTLFERMCALRGMMNLLEDVYLHPHHVHELAECVLRFQKGVVEGYARSGGHRINGVFLTDDWGMQDRPFVSLDVFRQFFMPRYLQLVNFIHSAGWHVWFHTCGRVNDFIEEFIEIGCDVLHFEQPHVLGIEDIGRRFAGRVCFAATCDVQRTLPFKSPEGIKAEARLLRHRWGTPSGGFIGVEYDDPDAVAIPVENLRVMGEEWLRVESFVL
jgi:uroporphyrinogen-III decarboxylase